MSFFEFAFLGRIPATKEAELQKENERLRKQVDKMALEQAKADKAARDLALKLLEKQRLRRSEVDRIPHITQESAPIFASRVPSSVRSVDMLARDVMPSIFPKPTLKDKTQSNVIRVGTWLMVATMLLSFGGIITLAVLERNIPDILTVGVSSPLGYFGGMFSAYFGMQQK